MSNVTSSLQVAVVAIVSSTCAALITGYFAVQAATRQADVARVTACQSAYGRRIELIRDKAGAFTVAVADLQSKARSGDIRSPATANQAAADLRRASASLIVFVDPNLVNRSLDVVDATDEILDATTGGEKARSKVNAFQKAMTAWTPAFQAQISELNKAALACT